MQVNNYFFCKKWIFLSYFCMGLIGALLTTSSSIFFKNIGFSNNFSVSISSLLLAAYIAKPAFTPFLHSLSFNKNLILFLQISISFLILITGFSIFISCEIWIIILLLSIISILGSSQDALIDGKYVTNLSAQQQAKYCGLQSFSWNMGFIFITGGLVSASGHLYTSEVLAEKNWGETWGALFILIAIIFFLIATYSYRLSPNISNYKKKYAPAESFILSYRLFLRKKNILTMLMMIFIYKFFISMTEKILPLFLMDSTLNGGMGLSNSSLGTINGTIGMIALLIGSFLGGLAVALYGLRKSLLSLCLATNMPILLIFALSAFNNYDIFFISMIIFFEKLLIGFGSVGQILFIMQAMSNRRFGMVHYSYGTAVLTGSFIVAGLLGGILQQSVGYSLFFLICACGIPIVFFITRKCILTTNNIN